MSYSYAPHVARLVSQLASQLADAPSSVCYALIDAAALKPLKRSFQQRLSEAPSALLFEHTFAKAALDLSPVVLQLSRDPVVFAQQLSALDEACNHLPVMSILRSGFVLNDLVQQLRAVLLIEADDSPYLLRFADSQMLAAANAIFTAAQRASFFHGIQAWWAVDHQGLLHDAADPLRHPQAQPAAKLPLQLDAAQTNGLLSAALVPMLASQLRSFEPRFAQLLAHADQTKFICDCVATAQANGIDDEDQVMTWVLQRWDAEQQRVAS